MSTAPTSSSTAMLAKQSHICSDQALAAHWKQTVKSTVQTVRTCIHHRTLSYGSREPVLSNHLVVSFLRILLVQSLLYSPTLIRRNEPPLCVQPPSAEAYVLAALGLRAKGLPAAFRLAGCSCSASTAWCCCGATTRLHSRT